MAEKTIERWKADIAASTLVSPIDGVVLSKDLDLHTGEYLRAGAPFAEIANLDEWDLQVEVNERKIGRIATVLQQHPLPVNYILYSHSAYKLQSTLQNLQQISAIAYPREKEQVFILTLPSIEVPANLKPTLRPGLTGRAKVELGRRPTIWLLFKRIADWVRLRIIG